MHTSHLALSAIRHLQANSCDMLPFGSVGAVDDGRTVPAHMDKAAGETSPGAIEVSARKGFRK